MGYADRIDEWRRKAQEKAKELDEKYKLKNKLDEGLKAAENVVKKGAESVGDAAESVKESVTDVTKAGIDATKAGINAASNAASATAQAVQQGLHNLEDEHKVTENLKENVKKASEKAEEAFRHGAHAANEAFKSGSAKASDAFRAGSAKASSVASDFSEKARGYYEKASDAYNFGKAATRATGTVIDTISTTIEWVKTNPGKAAIVSLSLVVGTRIGWGFPNLDVTIIGQKGHWFFRSAVLAYTSRKLSEKYLAYLKRQEELVSSGQLSEAERERVRFQRMAAKYVGAPLLGAFNIAAGIAIMGEIFSPDHIVGFPIDLILGGNPIMETVWLFSNGLICIHNGYEFIMMAVAEDEQVQRVVRDIKGLLPPSTAEAN